MSIILKSDPTDSDGRVKKINHSWLSQALRDYYLAAGTLLAHGGTIFRVYELLPDIAMKPKVGEVKAALHSVMTSRKLNGGILVQPKTSISRMESRHCR